MTFPSSRALAIAPIAILLACGGEKSEPAPLRPVKYARISAANAAEARSFPASVQPRDATQLSFRVGGNLARLDVKMGGTVKSGQIIAALDQADHKVAVAQAQANYQSAKTSRDTAQSAFKRVEKLFEAGSSSQSDYENAKGQKRAAQAQLDAAGQQVKQAKNQLAYTELRAPFDGIVNSVAVKAGEQVGAGRPVAVISKGGALEINVGVPEGIVSRIAVGTPVIVTVSALSDGERKELEGTVREVGFVSENSTYPVRIALAEIPATLRPGMAADARFDLDVREGGLVVPTAAVGNGEKGAFVFFLDKSEGKTYLARKKNIVVGKLVGDSFEVGEGLSAGDIVATAGLANLVDGMAVTLLEPRAGVGPSARQEAGADR